MLLDDAYFPLVFLRKRAEADASLNERFEEILGRGAPFVLITDHGPDEHDRETAEERRSKALFFKTVRDRMRKFCRGMIVIKGDAPLSAAERVAAAAASKGFGFPIQFAADEEQATRKGTLLLEAVA